VVDVTMFRPFPGDLIGRLLKGRKGVAVLERTDQPLAEDLPIMREVRAALSKCLENGAVARGDGEAVPELCELSVPATCRACTRAPTGWARATCSPRA
jgi:pyruvate-ferredoxin/flavodoxin oxidoreductase